MRTAIGGSAAMLAAISVVAASSSSAGTTWFTRPISPASCASIMRDVRINSVALPMPIRRGSRFVEPSSALMLSLVKGSRNRA